MALSRTQPRPAVSPGCRGSRQYRKTSYPERCGIYDQVVTRRAVYQFNPNRELVRMFGTGPDWPHPHEWLKRTRGNDWIYYSTGGYTGVFETTGEYYLPNLPYPTNRSLGGRPLLAPPVCELLESWYDDLCEAADHSGLNHAEHRFFSEILAQTPERLAAKAERFHRAVGGRLSVLPPDTRHVDYNVLPLNLTTGCLYKCAFCTVKSSRALTVLESGEIEAQIEALAELVGPDLVNCNALFLGEHDSLTAPPELICSAIAAAQERLGLNQAYIGPPATFLFGSVTSLLEAPERLFVELERLPGSVFCNIGLESADQETLDLLGKPISVSEVMAAFSRLLAINDRYRSIEISANFVIDEHLPASHGQALRQLLRDGCSRTRDKGSLYLSPLRFEQPSRSKLFEFYRYKLLSRLPLYLYTIQQL